MAIKYVEEPLPAQQKLGFNINSFYGVNNTGTAANGEFVTCKNMTSDCYPYASPREPREVIASGIENPQRVLFCGDRLSYIAGGKLNVKSGEGFADVGEVGTVTSAVDFNNQKMLFYPTSLVYDYEDMTLTEPTNPSYLLKGYYNYKNSFDSTKNGGMVLDYGDRNRPTISAATYAICPKEGAAGLIEAGQATDEEGKPATDKKGNPIYNTITFNIEGYSNRFCVGDAEVGKPCIRLFVHAFDKDDKPLYSQTYNTEDCVLFTRFRFGQPILFNGVAPKNMYVQVGYYHPHSNNSIYDYSVDEGDGFVTDECYKQVDDDLANTNFKIWASKTSYPGPNSIPNIAYACMDNNRVVAVQGNNFYASCLGDYADWTDFTDTDGNPKETGAYAEELYTYGDFTGIIKYNSNVILTKADLTYICYGNKPPYRIQEVCNSGCISNNTIAEVDGYIYWLGRDGIYMFGGSVPRCISDNLNVTLTDAVACGFEHKYYICGNDGESYKLYVYDTQRNLWHIEDERQYVSLATKDGALYGLTADGEILKFNAGNERVEWEFTTSDFDFGTEYTKNLAKIYVRMKLYGQAYVDLYVRTNRQEWYKFANFQADGTSVIQAKAKLKKCDYFTLRFVGCGKAESMDVYADVTVGSQKHRSGDKLAVFRKM